jgi:hypothetical protein
MQPPTNEARDLTSLYTNELQPILGLLEEKRLRARSRALISLLVMVPVGGLLALLLMSWFGPFGLLITVILGAFAWFWINGSTQQTYRDFFKSEVIVRLARLIDPSLVFQQDGGITIEEFRQSGLYRTDIDRYKAEDYFHGQIGATAFRFSEVHAEYKTTSTDSDGRTSTQWHTIFRGLFFIADFNKHFQGRTFVLPDFAESTLGRIGQKFQEWGSKIDTRQGELVKLEDPEFERLFAVHSTDQVEARYILSTSLMQRLSAFRQQRNAPVAVSFVDSQIFLTISSSKNHFEPPSIWRAQASMLQEDVEHYFQDVQLAERVVTDLNLNLRIWSKA